MLRDDFHFVNPPILVPDGTFRTVQITQPNGVIQDIEVPNNREDIVEALKQMLISAIKAKLV